MVDEFIYYRLKQEIVLGIGGVRLLQALGFQIRQYHMNEGHSALPGIELLRPTCLSARRSAARRVAINAEALFACAGSKDLRGG